MSEDITWRVEERDTGTLCASGSAPTQAAAMREAQHYAMQYIQDGPIRMTIKQGRKTLASGTAEYAPEVVR